MMIKKDMLKGTALGLILGCSGAIFAQAPAVNIGNRHGNLRAAQEYIASAWQRIDEAQVDNRKPGTPCLLVTPFQPRLSEKPRWNFPGRFPCCASDSDTGLPAFVQCKGMAKAASTSGFVTNGPFARSDKTWNGMNGRERLRMLLLSKTGGSQRFLIPYLLRC